MLAIQTAGRPLRGGGSTQEGKPGLHRSGGSCGGEKHPGQWGGGRKGEREASGVKGPGEATMGQAERNISTQKETRPHQVHSPTCSTTHPCIWTGPGGETLFLLPMLLVYVQPAPWVLDLSSTLAGKSPISKPFPTPSWLPGASQGDCLHAGTIATPSPKCAAHAVRQTLMWLVEDSGCSCGSPHYKRLNCSPRVLTSSRNNQKGDTGAFPKRGGYQKEISEHIQKEWRKG